MQIKKLQLVGFKTFADKTEIEIGDGLTAVVGPNGCGKSNIADALLWVMGEQNPRSLRGTDSRDVIFNGTDKRKPLGMAEVRLTVDNSDKSLPVDFAEVTVTRRIYRSGESQYLLNNAPCRLKDIVELFLDTGVGKGAYGFVTQSEIDAVLSARPEDRRELFEEAAGIKKYRVKKREAVRKLESAEGNLNRVRDILHELEQQREPLAAQAENARRFLKLSERLQQIEVDLLLADVQKSDYELFAARRDRELDQETLARLDADLAALEMEAAAVAQRLAEAERELDAARTAHQSALSTVERTESQLRVAEERGRSSEQSAESLDAELKDLGERAAALRREIEERTAALAKVEGEEAAGREKLTAARSRLKELDAAVAEAARRADDRQGALRRMAEQRAQQEAALAGCRSRLTETEARLVRLDTESAAAREQLRVAEERVEQARAALAEVTAEGEAHQARRAALEADRREKQDAQSRARVQLDAARRLLAERSSRLNTLVELQESGEGFYQGVRAVLSAVKQKRLAGSYVPVVDLLTVPEDLRVAIEVALGAGAQDIVCDTEAEAKAAIGWLKQQRAGRATFLALPLLRPGQPFASTAARGVAGVIGVAADLVSVDPKYRSVLQLALGRVVLAEEMDSAVAASRRLSGGWSRIVTLEGELLSPGGALTGGSLGGRGAHLVGRKGEIDDLRGALPGVRADVERLTATLDALGAELAALEAAWTENGRLLSEAGARKAAAERDLNAAARDTERLSAVTRDQSAEQARLSAAVGALRTEEREWSAKVEAGRAEDTSADDAIAAAQEEARALAVTRDAARSEAVALEVAAGRLGEQRAAVRRERDAAAEGLRSTERALSHKQAQREMAGAQFADAASLRREMETRLAEAREALSGAEERLTVWRERRDALHADNTQKTGALRDNHRRRSETTQSIHEAELRIARLEVRLAQTAQRLTDEYGITQEEALARPPVQELPRETVNEVARLRREVRQMGQVNTGAVEEYERLTERHDFLAEQRADLEQARESILSTIAEIDESTRETFMTTYEAVREEFAKLFARLFGGGTTKLVLTNPDDLLETGIEVLAQPPGKKPQHLSLLSGGERALTAVALLFSFLAVRPSPFVLLDEVDAPLDGANVEKFVNLVRDFSQDTQFLIITHNPTTMEASPRWYGVTMREAGVSSILSYRVPQESLENDADHAVVLSSPSTAPV
jgi:chromosome segregation protein